MGHRWATIVRQRLEKRVDDAGPIGIPDPVSEEIRKNVASPGQSAPGVVTDKRKRRHDRTRRRSQVGPGAIRGVTSDDRVGQRDRSPIGTMDAAAAPRRILGDGTVADGNETVTAAGMQTSAFGKAKGKGDRRLPTINCSCCSAVRCP